MPLTIEERKVRREAGVERAKQDMTAVRRIHRTLINGRPPASEFRTPTAAVTAARTLQRELGLRLAEEGLNPQPETWGVSVGYISPDLTVVGFSQLFESGQEAALMARLDGQIMLGLIFGIADSETGKMVMGIRPFHSTKQTEAWLSELTLPVQLEIEDPQF